MCICIYIYVGIYIYSYLHREFQTTLGQLRRSFLFPIVHAHILMRQIYQKDFSLIILLEHCYKTRLPYKTRSMYQVYQLIQIR